MASRDSNQRIVDSFGENEQDKVKEYIDLLMAAVSDGVSGLRRTSALVIILMAAFEFIVASHAPSLTFAGFTISRTSPALVVIPPLVAYFFLQTAIDIQNLTDVIDVLHSAFQRWSPKGAANGLDSYLRPNYPLYLRQDWSQFDKYKAPWRGIEDGVTIVLGITFAAVVLVFEFQAIWVLFPEGGATRFAIWASSLGVTVVCAAMSAIYLAVAAANYR